MAGLGYSVALELTPGRHRLRLPDPTGRDGQVNAGRAQAR